MNINLQKFTGWLLLLIGLAIISWSIYSSFNIFTAKKSPYQIFKIEKKEIQNQLPTKEKMPKRPEELEKEIQGMVAEGIRELIPAEVITLLLNLIAWAIFASILIFAGFQIASLGIKLIRK